MANDLVRLPVPDPQGALPACTTDDVIRAFLEGRNQRTMRAYTFDLDDFARFCGLPGAAAAVEALLAAGHAHANRVALAYRAQLVARGLAAATIARRLSALRSMVSIARKLGRVAWALDVEGPRSQAYRDTRGPGLDGWRRMLAKAKQGAVTAVGKRNLALVLLMHDMGLRRGECIGLDLVDVSLGGDRSTVSVVGKGQTEAVLLTVPPKPRLALQAWVAARGDEPGPLFVRLDPAAGLGSLERMTGDAVCRMVRALSRRAGLGREARPHGLRHQGITRLLDLVGGCTDLSIRARLTSCIVRYTALSYDRRQRLCPRPS